LVSKGDRGTPILGGRAWKPRGAASGPLIKACLVIGLMLLSGGATDSRAHGEGSGADGAAGPPTTVKLGSEAHTFVVSPASGRAVLEHFNGAGPDHDLIQLRGFGFTRFADLQSRISQQGADARIALSRSASLLIRNTAAGALSADDFLLGQPAADGCLSFDDEFDALSLYDARTGKGRWKTNYWFGSQSGPAEWSSRTVGAGEQVLFVDPAFQGAAPAPLGLNPFTLKDGVVSLHVARAPDPALPFLHGQRYTAGLLSSEPSFAQQYGLFEIRMRTPNSKGLWPTFWLLASDHSRSEIDITEQVGDGRLYESLHWEESQPRKVSFSTPRPPATADGFHTYALLWGPESTTWYVDGVAVARTATPASLRKPMYLIISMGGGGSWPGPLPNDFKSASMDVDYVRVHRLADGTTDSSGEACLGADR